VTNTQAALIAIVGGEQMIGPVADVCEITYYQAQRAIASLLADEYVDCERVGRITYVRATPGGVKYLKNLRDKIDRVIK
jgi:DNA-binding PadR family transcriptional regulator